MNNFRLSANDKAQPLWRSLCDALTAELELQRRKNDHAMTEQQTAALRGRIACLKEIIALGNDRPMTGE